MVFFWIGLNFEFLAVGFWIFVFFNALLASVCVIWIWYYFFWMEGIGIDIGYFGGNGWMGIRVEWNG